MEWSDIELGPEDPVFKVTRMFKESKDPKKVSLGIGAYRDENGNPLVLEAVIRAKAELFKLPAQKWSHEYLPITGHASFTNSAQDLVFGKDLHKALGDRLVSIQAMSGTGACRLGCEFVSQFGSSKVLLLPNPTWGNHHKIAKHAGLKVQEYRYIDESRPRTPMLDFEGFIADLKAAPKGATVMLHMCAHNPTGVDPTPEQWDEIADVIKEQGLQPFFDNAYQGFASGDLHGDAYSVRDFVKKGLYPLIACSFAKNMGLYGERVGALHLVAPDGKSAAAAMSQIKIDARAMYSNPPQFGAQVAHMVMSNPEFRALWESELKQMAERIRSMRRVLRAKLEEKAKGLSWHHITDQIGMFSYSGLTKEQVQHCADYGSVFMLSTGRISMAGVNEGNVEHVASTIANSIKACPAAKEEPLVHLLR